jgi:hypothetical protein
MDDKQFKEQLSKIARWYIPIVSEGTTLLRKPMPNSETNERLGPIIEELIPTLRACSGCDKICNQRTNHTLKFTSIDGKRPKRRWEHTCQTCRKLLDPATMRAKDRPKSKYQLAKEAAAKGEGPKRSYWWNENISDTKKT